MLIGQALYKIGSHQLFYLYRQGACGYPYLLRQFFHTHGTMKPQSLQSMGMGQADPLLPHYGVFPGGQLFIKLNDSVVEA